MKPSTQNLPQDLTLPTLVVVACGVLWGVFWIPLRWIAATGVGAAWASLVFSIVMCLCPLPWAWKTLRQTSLDRGLLWTGLILGSAFTLYTLSLLLTDVIHAIMLFYLTPVWSTLGSFFVFGQKLTWQRSLAIILGLVGMAAILGVNNGLPIPHNWGDWMSLASGIMWSVGGIRTAAQSSRHIALPVLLFGLGGVISSAFFVALATMIGSSLGQTDHLAAGLPLTVLIALVFFVPPNFMVLWASQRMDPGRVGILLMGEVMVGAVTAALFSGEAFGGGEIFGAALIVAAGLTEVFSRSLTQSQK